MAVTWISTKDMPEEEWRALRSKTIGGSDAGAVMGVNQYVGAYAVWAEKTGQVQPADLSHVESVREGKDLEDYVAQRWMEATGKKVRRDRRTYYNSDYPFAHANIDRAVIGEDAGLELKTTTSWSIVQQCRDKNYPDTWYAQMCHYMMVTGKKKWYLGVLCFGKGLFVFEVERNEDDIEALAATEADFWNKYVLTKTPPPLDGTKGTTEAVKQLTGNSAGGTTADLSGVAMYVTRYKALKKQQDQIDKEMDECKNAIKNHMGSAERGTYNDVVVRYKTQKRKNFNRKRFEAANGIIPSVYFDEIVSRPCYIDV